MLSKHQGLGMLKKLTPQHKQIITAVLAVLVVGSLVLLNTGEPAPSGAIVAETPISMDSRVTETTAPVTLASLRDASIAQECAFMVDGPDGRSSGIVYLLPGKIRVDTDTRTTNGQYVQSSLIDDGVTVYVWSNNLASGGVRIPRAQLEEYPNAEQFEPIDPDVVIDYDCAPNTPPVTLFTPPSEVAFVDLGRVLVPPSFDTGGTRE